MTQHVNIPQHHHLSANKFSRHRHWPLTRNIFQNEEKRRQSHALEVRRRACDAHTSLLNSYNPSYHSQSFLTSNFALCFKDMTQILLKAQRDAWKTSRRLIGLKEFSRSKLTVGVFVVLLMRYEFIKLQALKLYQKQVTANEIVVVSASEKLTPTNTIA